MKRLEILHVMALPKTMESRHEIRAKRPGDEATHGSGIRKADHGARSDAQRIHRSAPQPRSSHLVTVGDAERTEVDDKAFERIALDQIPRREKRSTKWAR